MGLRLSRGMNEQFAFPDATRHVSLLTQLLVFKFNRASGTIIPDSVLVRTGCRAPGFWFPEWCFWFPWCFFPGMVFSVPGGLGGSQGVFSSRAGAFSVPRFGFAVPGMVCWAPVGVFCSRNGVSGSRPEGTAWRCLWFPYGVSSCFFLLLCFSLFVASFLFFSFCPFLTSCYFCFLSSVPAFPLPFLFLRFL